MIIELMKENDIDKVIDLWYEVSLTAHDFVDSQVWNEGKEQMKKKYLPISKTYVLKSDDKIIGFTSLLENNLAAIFIQEEYQNQGLGKKTIDFIKNDYNELILRVYKKNQKAVTFYEKNGFKAIEQSLDKATGEIEYEMIWKR